MSLYDHREYLGRSSSLPQRRARALEVATNSGNGVKRPIGIASASAPSQRPPKKNGPLLALRIIAVVIICFSIIWGCLIAKIASDMNTSSDRPPPLLARPADGPSTRRARIGSIIRQKISRIESQLRAVPLLDVSQMDSPILLITYNRPDYLQRALWKVFEHHPAQQATSRLRRNDRHGVDRGTVSHAGNRRQNRIMAGAPIIISQDGEDGEVQAVIETYRPLFELNLGVPLYHIKHPRVSVEPVNYEDEWKTPYKLLASHYGWALDQTFSGEAYAVHQKRSRQIPTPPLPQRVIILEEDIEIAADFFSLMSATADLLDSDHSLLAVSAYNDNGKEQFVADAKRLVRSDFFPGLGWMMSRVVWEGGSRPDHGLKNNWAPNGFWDDWLRENTTRYGRQFIRPEVSRTFHFGNIHGASAGETDGWLNEIQLGEYNMKWEEDLSYLDPSRFAESYWSRVSRAHIVGTVGEAKSYVSHSDVRLSYANFTEFKHLASEFGIMQDEKSGVPRTAYEGIVEIRYGRGNFFVYLTPPYISGNVKPPEHFGMKAWMRYSKEELMQELGIENIPDEFIPDW